VQGGSKWLRLLAAAVFSRRNSGCDTLGSLIELQRESRRTTITSAARIEIGGMVERNVIPLLYFVLLVAGAFWFGSPECAFSKGAAPPHPRHPLRPPPSTSPPLRNAETGGAALVPRLRIDAFPKKPISRVTPLRRRSRERKSNTRFFTVRPADGIFCRTAPGSRWPTTPLRTLPRPLGASNQRRRDVNG